jgi:hypothetical protein
MKILKSLWKSCLLILMSFVLVAWLFHTGIMKAHPQQSGTAHIFIVPVTILNAKSAVPQNLPGVRIAGISCIAKPTQKLPDAAVCYVATTLAN